MVELNGAQPCDIVLNGLCKMAPSRASDAEQISDYKEGAYLIFRCMTDQNINKHHDVIEWQKTQGTPFVVFDYILSYNEKGKQTSACIMKT